MSRHYRRRLGQPVSLENPAAKLALEGLDDLHGQRRRS